MVLFGKATFVKAHLLLKLLAMTLVAWKAKRWMVWPPPAPSQGPGPPRAVGAHRESFGTGKGKEGKGKGAGKGARLQY